MSDSQQHLPPGWAHVNVGEIFQELRGKVPADSASLLPFIGMDHVESDTMRLTGKGRFSEMKSAGAKFYPGDILYGRLRPYLNKVFHAEFEGVSSAEFLVFPQSRAIRNDFFKYILTERSFVNFSSHPDNVTGDRPRIDFDTIAKYQFNLPPCQEQGRIVSKIEELFSDLDKGEESLRQAQAQLKRYRQSALKAAVTGELTRDWREQNKDRLETGDALLKRILKARREAWEKAELEKMRAKGVKPKDDSWKKKYCADLMPLNNKLSCIPSSWVKVRIDITGGVQLGRQRSPKHHHGPNMRPYLRVANVFEEHIDVSDVMEMNFTEDEFVEYRLTPGDILLNEGQSADLVGRPAMYRGEVSGCCFTNTLVRYKNFPGVVDKKYALIVFLYFMHSGAFKKIAKITTNIAHLGAGRFSELAFPLPSIEEQILIAEKFHVLKQSINETADMLKGQRKKMKALRQSILKSAFSGTLVPQDPNDEPASKMLKRIAAEKTTSATPLPARRAGPRQKRREAQPAAKQAELLPVSHPKQNVAGLAQLRKAAGMSQAKLAKAIGLNQAYISQMETGKRVISKEIAEAMSRALDVDPTLFAV